MTTPVGHQRTQVEPAEDSLGVEENPWQTVVWNDPVNLMSYVTYVFQKLFGYSRDKATELMLQDAAERFAALSSDEQASILASFEDGEPS